MVISIALPGYDFSGRIIDILPLEGTTTNFSIGDRILCCNWGTTSHNHADEDLEMPVGGAFAQYISIPISKLSKLPDQVSYAEGAAVALVGLTAYQSIFDCLKLSAGQRVLILGKIVCD